MTLFEFQARQYAFKFACLALPESRSHALARNETQAKIASGQIASGQLPLANCLSPTASGNDDGCDWVDKG